jgi:alpha-amylase/alpha-mannosidase (GH57 family)
MPADNRLPVVFCWHMHQPEYRDLASGVFTRPWTYLHATKDYTDMAAHLEAQPAARAVINFSPVLIEQLEAYQAGLQRAFDTDDGQIGDPLLDALAARNLDQDPNQRDALLRACLRLNKAGLVEPFPAFANLYALAESVVASGSGARYFSDEFLHDLLTWYHLAWLGSTVRKHDPRAAALIARQGAYRYAERRELLHLIHDCIAGLRGRYRALAAQGRIEISVSPWGHPILPLLIDFQTARESQPDTPLPRHAAYPDGMQRVRWHLDQARRCIEDNFGVTPAGCWPSEGALSQDALQAIAAAGFTWTATGQQVLGATLERAGRSIEPPRMYQDQHCGIKLFARDDGLSDRIGFVYSSWDPEQAVHDLERSLLDIAARAEGKPALVAIIMDGENAWEHYPDNAAAFLSILYERLGNHQRLRLTTFNDAARELEPAELPPLVAGSWVYGTLSTWIGVEAKNRLWDLLIESKHCYDELHSRNPESNSGGALQERQLGVCEGSDWFWWPSDHQPEETVSEFESLFGMHLANLYRGAGREPPATIAALLESEEPRAESGPVMRPGVPPTDRE